MKKTDVKIGKVYLMKNGHIGRIINQFNRDHFKAQVVFPFRVESLVAPRDIDREVAKAEVPPQLHAELFPEAVKS